VSITHPHSSLGAVDPLVGVTLAIPHNYLTAGLDRKGNELWWFDEFLPVLVLLPRDGTNPAQVHAKTVT